jgi:hypothetical protein
VHFLRARCGISKRIAGVARPRVANMHAPYAGPDGSRTAPHGGFFCAQDAKCADGYLAVEKAGECACEWPCDGLHCQGPFVAMPDYERKNPDELCICQLPPKSKCHDEL